MLSAAETAAAVRRRELKATEALEESLAAIERRNEALGAFVHLDAEAAFLAASAVDKKLARGEEPGPLAGVPIGVKDLEDCAGMPTAYGSLLYKGSPPAPEDSVHVARLRAAGAVPVGKTATPEFGSVAFTSTRGFGTARNPWDPSRTPGGSSGGSAAAVAGGLVPLCTASDGGGSIRIPASFCGLVGLKPSYGRIPHPKAAPSQTSCYGVMATTVADAALHLDVAAGPDDRDRGSLPAPALRYSEAAEKLDVSGLRAAWSVDLGFAVVEPEVAAVTAEAARSLAKAANLRLIERPVALTDPVRTWMASGVLDLWASLPEGAWPARAGELEGYNRAILQAAEQARAPEIAAAWADRARLEQEVAQLMADVDVLLTPATAVAAYAAEGPMPEEIDGKAVHPAMSVPFTMLANLCWNPAISLPAGRTSAGLPIGLQVVARRHRDEVALRLGRIWEQAHPWPRVAPAG